MIDRLSVVDNGLRCVPHHVDVRIDHAVHDLPDRCDGLVRRRRGRRRRGSWFRAVSEQTHDAEYSGMSCMTTETSHSPATIGEISTTVKLRLQRKTLIFGKKTID